MQRASSSFDSSDEGVEYHAWYHRNLRKGTAGPKAAAAGASGLYLPWTCTRNYFDDKIRVRQFLKVLFTTKYDIVQSSTELVQTTYRTVFAILLRIGKGTFIEHFVKHPSLSDKNLPFEIRPANFPWTSTAKPDFFDSFQKEQWAFCVPIFSNMTNNTIFHPNLILPILSRERISKGGSALVDKIRIDPEYDGMIDSPLSTQADTDDLGHTYVLKSYSRSLRGAQYHAEVEAFRRLRHVRHPHSLIQYFGSYEQDNTFNIILEYADGGTLEGFLRNEKIKPPRKVEDIQSFWCSLFDILLALQTIHRVKQDGGGIGSQDLHGWHQDVKPENILVFKPSDPEASIFQSRFKLADLGLSHFGNARDTRGTRTYGAPECYRENLVEAHISRNVPNTIDIWSLGCVLSEASYWLLHGSKGLDIYQRHREMETEEDPQFQDQGAFHYKKALLRSVELAHLEVSEGMKRHGDWLTPKVIDIVGWMLYPGSDRVGAEFLYNKLWQERFSPQQRSSMPYAFPINTDLLTGAATPLVGDADRRSSRDGSAPIMDDALGIHHQANRRLSKSHNRDSETSQGSRPLTRTAKNGSAENQSTSYTPPNPARSIPSLSIEYVIHWKRQQKEYNRQVLRSKGTSFPLPGHEYANELKGRDVVFILDDSGPMQGHWDELCYVLDPLAYVLKTKDPDKMQLIFAVDHSGEGRMGDCTPLISAVQQHRGRFPSIGDHLASMQDVLTSVLSPYIEKLQPDRKRRLGGLLPPSEPPRAMSMYILTAGVWRPYSDVAIPIGRLVAALVGANLAEQYVSLQFIQFGDDPRGTEELDRLDKHLDLSRDIVDTEPSNGNFWKMTLGAKDPWFDDDKRAPTTTSRPEALSPVPPVRNSSSRGENRRISTHSRT